MREIGTNPIKYQTDTTTKKSFLVKSLNWVVKERIEIIMVKQRNKTKQQEEGQK